LEGYANLFIFENATKGADAILVLGGRNETRVDKAIELLKDGYSSQIYLTSPIDIADKYSFIQTQREIGEMILEYHNIQIQKVPYREKPATSTKDEVLDFCEYQKTQGWERVIVVTDQFHTRRAYFAFWKYCDGRADIEIAGAESRIYTPQNWWKSEQGLLDFIPEFFKFLIYIF
jgi:uncharacterized SAM-binding protein YcdF (DUF218 family)